MYKRIKKEVIAVILVIFLGIVFYSVSAASSDVIKIGVPAPYTGPAALLGSKMKQAAELAADEINERGGVLGKKVELVFGDTESSPEKGIAVFERFITKDKVVGIAGCFHSSVVMATSDVTERYGMPFIEVSGASDKITQRGYKTVFRMVIRSSQFADYYVGFAKEFLLPKGITRYSIIAENTDWGRDMSRFLPERLKNTEAELVGIDVTEVGCTDFYSQLTKAKGQKAEVIYTSITSSSAYALITQADELRVPALLIFGIPEPQFKEAKEICGSALNTRTLDLVMFAAGNPISEKSIPFTEAYHKRYGEDPAYVAAEQYDAIYILCDAIERASSLDKEKILETLRTTDYTGVRGPHLKFDAEGNLTPRAFIFQIQDYKQVILYPEEFAAGELKLLSEK